MRLLSLDPNPVAEVPYLNAAGAGRIEEVSLPVICGWVLGLPPDLDAIVAASDLQGRERGGDSPGRLIGERLAEELARLGEAGVLPAPCRIGVLLVFRYGLNRGEVQGTVAD